MFGVNFAAPVLLEGRALRDIGDAAEDYTSMLHLEEEMILLDKERDAFFVSRPSANAMAQERNKRYDINARVPNSWFGFRLRTGRLDDPWPESGKARLSDMFRSEIGKNARPVTGNDLLQPHIQKVMSFVERMPAEDRRQVQTALARYLKRNDAILQERLNVYAAPTADSAAVVAAGLRVIENLGRFHPVVTGMGKEVSELVRNGK